MILPENEFSRLKGVMSVSNHIWTSEPMHHIWPEAYHLISFWFDQKMFIFLFFTAVPRTLHVQFLFSFYLTTFSYSIHWRPFPVCLLPLCQVESKCETIHMTPAYKFLTHFHMKGFARRLLLKQRHKKTFIHELLTGVFDLFLAFLFISCSIGYLFLVFVLAKFSLYYQLVWEARWPHGQRCPQLRIERSWFEPWLGKDIVLCSWRRQFTLTVPLSSQVYEWAPAD